MLILAFALCAALGYLAITSIWPHKNSTFSALMIRVSLAPGFGLGIFSAVFWLMRLRGGAHVVAVDASFLIVLGLTYSVRRSCAAKETTHSLSSRAKMNCPGSSGNSSQSRDLAFASQSLNQSFPAVLTKAADTPDIHATKWVARTLMVSLLIAVITALYQATVRVIAHPHGEGWDAFAIWNLHARFLFLGGAHWRDGFNSMIPWSHPDYPLLLPTTISHLWSYLGHDDPIGPAIVGLIFTFSTFALLVSSLVSLRGRNAAMLGGLALSSTPFFIEQGTSQYADVPLSFFILASFVLLHVARIKNRKSQNLAPMMLSGMAAGFAAWTKNEGLLFLSALLVALVWDAISSARQQDSSGELAGKWRVVAFYVFGATPLFLVIAWFNHTIAVPGDLLSSPSIMFQKILTPTRYWIILQWFVKELLRFGNWWIIPGTVSLLTFYLLIFKRRKFEYRPALHISALTLLLTLAGYFAIYLITPRDLYWHLRFSLNRLFLQLWPSAIFLFFLFVGRQTLPRSQTELSPQSGKL
jgi:Dolichyl-phosphate-mannose-protein mannosyltransferase